MTPADLAEPAFWIPLVAALVTGGLIGLEREFRAKAAGFRTHALVCFSSALLAMAGARQADWVLHLIDGTNIVSDPARMPHGILTGIGFLCAGVIFRQGSIVHGLTTAASLWSTAALGILYGAGLLWMGLAGAVTTLIVLALLRMMQRLLPDHTRVHVRICVATEGEARAASDLLREHAHRLVAPPGRRRYPKGSGPDQIELTAILWLHRHEDFHRLGRAIEDLPGALSYDLIPEDMITTVPPTPAPG